MRARRESRFCALAWAAAAAAHKHMPTTTVMQRCNMGRSLRLEDGGSKSYGAKRDNAKGLAARPTVVTSLGHLIRLHGELQCVAILCCGCSVFPSSQCRRSMHKPLPAQYAATSRTRTDHQSRMPTSRRAKSRPES